MKWKRRDPNQLTAEERKVGFELIFGDRDFEGWQQEGNWILDDGGMFRSAKGGAISYRAKKIPDDFELTFQWKVAQGSNSRVYYRPGQYEYQILDNQAHADGQNSPTSAASLYSCMGPSHDATRPFGQWNSARIIAKGTVIQHWLNGRKVIDFDYIDPRWADNVELLRLRGTDLAARGAFLTLQDHGDPVWYRAIKLLMLGPDDQLERSQVTPQPVPRRGDRERARDLEAYPRTPPRLTRD